MLQFDSDRNRWILVCDDNQGLVDSKHEYWSSDNADRDVPWSESDEMSGTSWRLDDGTKSESKFKFKGMPASVCCVTWPPKTFIGSTLVRQRAAPCELRALTCPEYPSMAIIKKFQFLLDLSRAVDQTMRWKCMEGPELEPATVRPLLLHCRDPSTFTGELCS